MDPASANPFRVEIEQAITALKKGAYLLKHGRRGTPKLCHFRLSDDESVLLWSYKNKMKQLVLRDVLGIDHGQSTVYFRRNLHHEKEGKSFSVIYKGGKSLDLVCNDKEEAKAWVIGLLELFRFGDERKRMRDSSTSTSFHSQASGLDSMNGDMKVNARASLSSDVSSSSQGSAHDNGKASGKDENFANLVDTFFNNIFSSVESLTRKAQILEAELTKSSNPLKGKIGIAVNRTGKCKVD